MLDHPPLQTKALFDSDPYLPTFEAEVVAVSGDRVALSQSCFYPVGGGQPGDIGHIAVGGAPSLAIVGAQRDAEDPQVIWHRLESPQALTPGLVVRGQIDWPRRHAHMRMHTTLHLLCSLVNAPVTGCSISADKGRLDFDLPEATATKEDLTEALARLIAEDHPVRRFVVTENIDAEIAKLTRTAAVAPPVIGGCVSIIEIAGVDVQPCGGTHVASTKEIGAVHVAKIEKKGRRNRRISLVFD